MRLLLSDGTQISDPSALIANYYERDAHELYDSLEVPQDNKLDLAALSSLAFFEVFNPRLEQWRQLWNLRSEIEAMLGKIPPNLELMSEEIPWLAVVDIFNFFFLRVRGFGFARASKVLHKKRPHLIPILDTLVTKHYCTVQDEVFKEKPRREKVFGWAAKETISAIRTDIIANKEVLVKLQHLCKSRGINLTLVRTFDVVVWEWGRTKRREIPA
jgi:hypothetical protein